MTLCTTDIIRPLSSADFTISVSVKAKPFIVTSFMDFTENNNAEASLLAIDAICSLGYRVRLLLRGAVEYQKQCLALQKKHPKHLQMFEDIEGNREDMLKKADVYFSGEYPTNEIITEMVEKGIVPIVPNNGLFINFDPQAESGNAFTFTPGNFWQMVEAFIRARETRKFSYDWRNIRQSVRQTVV